MQWFWDLSFFDRLQIGLPFVAIFVPLWLIVRQLDQIINLLNVIRDQRE